MTTTLSAPQARALVFGAFRPAPRERRMALLVDLPDDRLPDHPAWADRRALAEEWHRLFAEALADDGFEVHLFAYPNVRTNNADLPARAWRIEGPLPASVAELGPAAATRPGAADDGPGGGESKYGDGLPFEQIFESYDLFLAPTELSTTAPLKMAARRHDFKAATMPSFSRAMVPALGLDIGEVDRRCQLLKDLLDRAEGADLVFHADDETHRLHLDLRHRTAHASSGLLATPGTAGNLPSGETYIVPYEGELEGDPSRTRGFLPVQLDDDDGETGVVVYRVLENRAVGIRPAASGTGTGGDALLAEREAAHLQRDPAYGNVAELGLGVLAAFGVEPLGEVLLDEKLGPHIAFGRSDHFGGQVGPGDFASPDTVVHIDRVYLPSTQPRVQLARLELILPGNQILPLVRDGEYEAAIFDDPGGDGARGKA